MTYLCVYFYEQAQGANVESILPAFKLYGANGSNKFNHKSSKTRQIYAVKEGKSELF